MRLGLFSYWVDSYWGGAVAAMAGCLALGALGRMKQTIRARDAAWMGIGFSILANSRPYEGLLLAIGIGVTIVIRMFRGGTPDWQSLVMRGALPMLIPISLTAVFMCFYFRSTTGNPFVSPYQVYNHTYGVMPLRMDLDAADAGSPVSLSAHQGLLHRMGDANISLRQDSSRIHSTAHRRQNRAVNSGSFWDRHWASRCSASGA